MSARPGFEQIFEDTYEPIRRYVARRVSPDAVQDVVADTYLVAWRRFEELRGEPLPWLLAIARRVAATQRRGSARREALGRRLRSEATAGVQPAPQEVAGEDPQLERALALLPERDREALLLTVWDGLSHATAARAMGCSTGALTVRLHRARRRLARLLEAEQPRRDEAPGCLREEASSL